MTWKNPPTRFTRVAAGDMESHTRRVAFQILRELVIVSPVDTGRFVNNWFVGLGNKNLRTTDVEDPGRTAALNRGERELKRFRTSQRSIWISNNLPYAERLNDGWSQRAPANFVQQAIAKVTR